MPPTLNSLTTALTLDPGLNANVSAAERAAGIAAANAMNAQLLQIIAARALNADGLIRPEELEVIVADVQGDPAALAIFLDGHGDDEGDVETGFHLLQNDGGTLEFRGRDFVDTVADAIYHYGFDIIDGRYVNEDGNANETTRDVAGWLNYFLNGVSAVFGTDGAETLHSGDYSAVFADARNETFYAGAGNDSVWADIGNDTVQAGTGDDVTGGGEGNDSLIGDRGWDTLYGDAGDDTLDGGTGSDRIGAGVGHDVAFGGDGNDRIWGDSGNDQLDGGAGDDDIGGGDGDDRSMAGAGNDTVYGGQGSDRFWGEDGDDMLAGSEGTDRLDGGAGNDTLHGGDGRDGIYGGAGNDTISGGEGADLIRGGEGRDLITLWESVEATDTLVFALGDSGRSRSTVDRVEGFDSGRDKIDLRAFGDMVFADLDYEGGGQASFYHDGRHLRIDADGNSTTDMIIEFAWVSELQAGDFLLA